MRVKGETLDPMARDTTTKYGFYGYLASTYRTSSGWRFLPFLVAGLVLIPIGTVISSFFAPAGDIWQHLVETTLAGLLINTFWLVLGVASGTALLGVSLAWFTAVCEFPGRKFFSWALLLPLAIPAYVTAFVALGCSIISARCKPRCAHGSDLISPGFRMCAAGWASLLS